MANYFTEFSCLLPVGSAANAQAALAIHQAMTAEREAEEDSLGFEAEIQSDPGDGSEASQVWIFSSEGEPEDVLEYVFRCAKAFSLTGIWGFRWSLSCSRPLLDAYGGGGQIVDLGTCETIDWIDLDHWLIDQADPYLLRQLAASGEGRPPQEVIERQSAARRRHA